METKEITRISLLTSLSLLLSYIETLLPSFVPVPGIKLGLANTAVVFALYTLSFPDALLVSLLRVFISSLLFGNVLSLVYSLSGAVVSFLVMALLRKLKAGEIAVSISGGISHNGAQLAAAVVILKSTALTYYLPVLTVSGIVTGGLIGFISSIVLKRIERDDSIPS